VPRGAEKKEEGWEKSAGPELCGKIGRKNLLKGV